MADGTHIEWTDATWNIVNGCSVVSPGCTNCYAMRLAGTRLRNHPSREGLTQENKAGPVWTGEVRFNEKVLTDPLRWRKPRRIFVCAHGDLFHDNVPDEWIARVFAVMALCVQHQFQVLTKRPERMREYLRGWDRNTNGHIMALAQELKPSSLWNGNVFQAHHEMAEKGYIPNVWLGVSVEDQQRADERIPILLDTPAAIRWLSCEPLLGPVDLSKVFACSDEDGAYLNDAPILGLDWVVAGGESGPGARPMHPGWARSLRDQCAAAGVPFLFKQWGEFGPIVTTGHNDSRYPEDPQTGERMDRVGKKAAGRLLDGVQHDGFPA
jgi:protein gp37